MPDYSSVGNNEPQYGVVLILVIMAVTVVMAKIYNSKRPAPSPQYYAPPRTVRPTKLPPPPPKPTKPAKPAKAVKVVKAAVVKPAKVVKTEPVKPKTSPDVIRDAVDALVAMGMKKGQSSTIVKSLVNNKDYADASTLIFDAFKVK